jgi:phosphohistidine phosphatase
MRHLILMRHAKAEKGSPSGGDHDRPLAERGRDDAARIARALSAKGLRPDMALVSDAARTRQTWAAVEPAFENVELRVERDLYNASAEAIIAAVDTVADGADTLLVVAHNPGIHEAALSYLNRCSPSPAILDKLAGRFPTGSAAIFRFDGRGCGFAGVLTPKALGGGDDD